MKYEEYAAFRDANGLTDYRISEDTKISRSTFTQWKKGDLTPSPITIAKLNKYIANYEQIAAQKALEQEQMIDNTLAPKTIETFGLPYGIHVSGYIVTMPNGVVVEIGKQEFEQFQSEMKQFIENWLENHKDNIKKI